MKKLATDTIEKVILILAAAFGIPFLFGLFKGATGWGAVTLGMSLPLMEPLIAIGVILALVVWVSFPLIEAYIQAVYGK